MTFYKKVYDFLHKSMVLFEYNLVPLHLLWKKM